MNWDERIRNCDLQIGIIGLGYVGLPLAVAFAEGGFTVTGFDTDEEKVRTITDGESPLPDVSSQRIKEVTDSGHLRATSDMSEMSEMDALNICVPTPLRKSRDPDISYIAEATSSIVENFTPPGLIILESTTYPGTTEEILSERFQAAGWTLDEDIYLAFSPERIDPSNEEYGIENTPKVVGGSTSESGDLAGLLYEQIVEDVVRVSDTRAAEMVKLLENTFRSINIALANEMALICDRLGIDVWEVIDAAATKPYGFMPFYPGPGLGGHCIPVDPLFLSWKARLADTQSQFVELADEINRSMPGHVVSKITKTLNEEKKCVNGAEICLLGVAYKADVNDTRESPANEIVDELRDLNADLFFCDPFVESFEFEGRAVPSLSQEELQNRDFDAGVILTAHSTFDWEVIRRSFSTLIDTRNAYPEELKQGGPRVVTL